MSRDILVRLPELTSVVKEYIKLICFLQMRSHVAQAGPELLFSCRSPPSSGVIGVHHLVRHLNLISTFPWHRAEAHCAPPSVSRPLSPSHYSLTHMSTPQPLGEAVSRAEDTSLCSNCRRRWVVDTQSYSMSLREMNEDQSKGRTCSGQEDCSLVQAYAPPSQ